MFKFCLFIIFSPKINFQNKTNKGKEKINTIEIFNFLYPFFIKKKKEILKKTRHTQ